MAKKVITVFREQQCNILVDVPNDWDHVKCHQIDANALCQGVAGLEWEIIGDYLIDTVRNPDEESLSEVSGEKSLK
jgi:hypothetical protein